MTFVDVFLQNIYSIITRFMSIVNFPWPKVQDHFPVFGQTSSREQKKSLAPQSAKLF